MVKIDHYTRKKIQVRYMTNEEAKQLKRGDVIKVVSVFDTVINVKVNGNIKRWKRTPLKLQIPIKYGLYEYGYITFIDDGNLSVTSIVPVVEVN